MNPHSWRVSNVTVEGEYQGKAMRVFPATCKRCPATTVFPAHATHWDKRHRAAQTECISSKKEAYADKDTQAKRSDGPVSRPVAQQSVEIGITQAQEARAPEQSQGKEASVNKGKKITSSKEYEKRRKEITEALTRTDGHVPSAAKELDIPESTLRGLVKEWTKPIQVAVDHVPADDLLNTGMFGDLEPVPTKPALVMTADEWNAHLLKLAAEHEDAARVLREAAKLAEA